MRGSIRIMAVVPDSEHARALRGGLRQGLLVFTGAAIAAGMGATRSKPTVATRVLEIPRGDARTPFSVNASFEPSSDGSVTGLRVPCD